MPSSRALRGTGLDVIERDVDANLLTTPRRRPLCVVPMLHGETGEDGAIREVFELLGVPYVGAPPASCRAAFDKPVAKAVAAGRILTPASVCLPETFRELGAREVMAALVDRLGLPMMVKPAKSGSALGCSVVRTAEELPSAMVNAFAYGDVALLEQFVEAWRWPSRSSTTVRAPGAARGGIHADGGVYDYTARYTAGSTEFITPAPLSPELADEVARVALTAHQVLGLRDLART